MPLRNIAIFGIVAVLIIAYVAWTRNMQRPAPAGQTQTEEPATGSAPQMPPSGDASGGMPPSGGQAQPPVVQSASNPGIAWKVPGDWTDQGGSSMRLATYVFPGPNNTQAQCAVYYFGPGQGGTVGANIDRWRGEFKDAKSAQRKSMTVNGISITRIGMNGTYLAHVGMLGAGSSTEMPHWSLLGAIAEGPSGSVFFKLTGPEATVKAAATDFDAMLGSIHKE